MGLKIGRLTDYYISREKYNNRLVFGSPPNPQKLEMENDEKSILHHEKRKIQFTQHQIHIFFKMHNEKFSLFQKNVSIKNRVFNVAGSSQARDVEVRLLYFWREI